MLLFLLLFLFLPVFAQPVHILNLVEETAPAWSAFSSVLVLLSMLHWPLFFNVISCFLLRSVLYLRHIVHIVHHELNHSYIFVVVTLWLTYCLDILYKWYFYLSFFCLLLLIIIICMPLLLLQNFGLYNCTYHNYALKDGINTWILTWILE